MPTTAMPEHLTKVSYILPKSDKSLLERAAKKQEKSMSEIITDALLMAGILKQGRRAKAV